MGTSPSTFRFTTPSSSLRKYGPFDDRFMYKYLSRLLGAVRPSIPTARFAQNHSSGRSLMTNLYSGDDLSDSQLFEMLQDDALLSESAFTSAASTLRTTSSSSIVISSEWTSSNSSSSTCENCSSSWSNGDYPLPLPHTIAIIIAGTLLSIVTAGGNLMVMASFRIERQLQTISNYFLFSLAAADLLIGLISIPLMTYYTAKEHWDLGYTTCQFWLSIDYLMSNASVMNLLLISFDRYFSVTRPLTYRPRRTSKKAMIMIASTYLISCILWPPLIIGWPYIEGRFEVEDNECIVQFLRTSPAVTVVTATVAFYGPVVIMIVLYGRVYYVTKTRQRELIKLQAFNQQSIRRTISSNSDARLPLRTTLSTASSAGGGTLLASFGQKIHRDSNGLETDLDLTSAVYCNNNGALLGSRSSPGNRSVTRFLSRDDSTGDVKPWGFQALIDHFTRPKPIHSTRSSSRQGSMASSGFEDEESGGAESQISGETTTAVTEEATPLKRRHKQAHHAGGNGGGCSPSPSDYGSTLANQFLNSVRQSFMVRRKSKVELAMSRLNRFRSMSNPHPRQCRVVQVTSMLTHPHRYYQQQRQSPNNTLHPEVIENSSASGGYDPMNSPIQELRRMSAQTSSSLSAATRRSPNKCAGFTHSAPTPGMSTRLKVTDEEDEEALERAAARASSPRSGTPTRSISTPADVQQGSNVYTVLIQLGKSAAEHHVPPAPPRPRVNSSSHRKATTSNRNRPMITLHSSGGDSFATLSPDRGTSTVSSFSTADISSVPSVVVRRLSSSGSATSDPVSPAAPHHRATSPLLVHQSSSSSGRKRSQALSSSGAPTPASANTPSPSFRRAGVNRMSSGRSGGTSSNNANTTTNPAANHPIPTGRSTRRRKKGERRQQESKAARTLSAILLAFVVTWAPYNFIVCIESFNANSVPAFWFTFSYYLCYLNSTINPFLYALCNATFRRAFWRILTLKWSPAKIHHKRPPHHQAAVAMMAVSIAATNRHQPLIASPASNR